MEVKATLTAMVGSYSSIKPQDLCKPESVGSLHFVTQGSEDYWLKTGYTVVGTAEVKFVPVGMKELVDNKVAALRNEAAGIRAEATAKCTRIEGQIQNLLSIGYDGSDVFDKQADESDIPF